MNNKSLFRITGEKEKKRVRESIGKAMTDTLTGATEEDKEIGRQKVMKLADDLFMKPAIVLWAKHHSLPAHGNKEDIIRRIVEAEVGFPSDEELEELEDVEVDEDDEGKSKHKPRDPKDTIEPASSSSTPSSSNASTSSASRSSDSKSSSSSSSSSSSQALNLVQLLGTSDANSIIQALLINAGQKPLFDKFADSLDNQVRIQSELLQRQRDRDEERREQGSIPQRQRSRSLTDILYQSPILWTKK